MTARTLASSGKLTHTHTHQQSRQADGSSIRIYFSTGDRKNPEPPCGKIEATLVARASTSYARGTSNRFKFLHIFAVTGEIKSVDTR